MRFVGLIMLEERCRCLNLILQPAAVICDQGIAHLQHGLALSHETGRQGCMTLDEASKTGVRWAIWQIGETCKS